MDESKETLADKTVKPHGKVNGRRNFFRTARNALVVVGAGQGLKLLNDMYTSGGGATRVQNHKDKPEVSREASPQEVALDILNQYFNPDFLGKLITSIGYGFNGQFRKGEDVFPVHSVLDMLRSPDVYGDMGSRRSFMQMSDESTTITFPVRGDSSIYEMYGVGQRPFEGMLSVFLVGKHEDKTRYASVHFSPHLYDEEVIDLNQAPVVASSLYRVPPPKWINISPNQAQSTQIFRQKGVAHKSASYFFDTSGKLELLIDLT